MRSIDKRPEPSCLADARRDALRDKKRIEGSDYNDHLGAGCKQHLREQLVAEQVGLCAYCGGRIKATVADRGHPSQGGMTIEHWAPRSGYKGEADIESGQLSLTWGNLLGVCVGISLLSAAASEQHCDVSRGNQRLCIHPAQEANLPCRFRYNKASGRMSPTDEQDADAAMDITTLNLNSLRLSSNRKEVIRRLQVRLRNNGSTSVLRRLYAQATMPNKNGQLTPYAFVAQQYLHKKMRQRGLI